LNGSNESDIIRDVGSSESVQQGLTALDSAKEPWYNDKRRWKQSGRKR